MAVPFNCLCLGAKFKYSGSEKVWVKIGSNSIAEWDRFLVQASWAGQQICCFDETDEGLGREVVLVDDGVKVIPSRSYRLPNGTKVLTKRKEKESLDWTLSALALRKFPIAGEIIGHHDSHGLCYVVLHDDGTQGYYEPDEFEVLGSE